MSSKYFHKALQKVAPENKIFIKKNLDITEQILAILDKKGMTRRDLAKALGKSEPEVSRMLSGLHNLTLKTIAKLEVALGEEVIMTPLKAEEKWGKLTQGKVISFSSSGVGFERKKGGDFHSGVSESQTMAAFVKETILSKRLVSKVSIQRELRQA